MTDDGTAAGNTQPLPAAEAAWVPTRATRRRRALWSALAARVARHRRGRAHRRGDAAAPVTLAVLWMNHDLLNTDNYVKTVAPLSSNPDVQNAVATDVTDQLWAKVNVQQQLSGVLPSWAQVSGLAVQPAQDLRLSGDPRHSIVPAVLEAVGGRQPAGPLRGHGRAAR